MTERTETDAFTVAHPLAEGGMVRETLARLRSINPLTALCFVLTAIYIVLFVDSVLPYWFHPGWTTDDALQQVFPFHEAITPGIFDGDLIAMMMKCYLAPIHYWMGMGITILTGDVMMTAHWMMLIQIVLSSVFLFLAVRSVVGVMPALFSVMWLFHTRHIMQRLTSGLPRGWAEVVFTGYLFLVLTGRHRWVLVLFACGCLLHPPATVLVALCHGMYLVWKFLRPASRAEFRRPLIEFLVLSPVLAVLAFFVTRMPAEIGTMADYATASQMVEFQEPLKGRFPFLPLKEPWSEIRSFGFQAFIGRFHNPGRFWKSWMPTAVMLSLFAVVALGLIRKRKSVPEVVWFFLIAALVIYFASRALVFKLYVPNRHLQFPFATFFIVAFSIGIWRVFLPGKTSDDRSPRLKDNWSGALGLLLIGLLVFAGSGMNLNGAANFNWAIDKRGWAFKWLAKNTAPDSLIAGEPTLVDPVQLFAARKAFVTTETAHPFYDRYYAEMKRRLEISLRAHYARDLKELVALLQPEGIDYFLFDREIFNSKTLENASYFPPYDGLVKELASRPEAEYAYRMLPPTVDMASAPYMPFKDRRVVVVDIHRLSESLK